MRWLMCATDWMIHDNDTVKATIKLSSSLQG